MNHFLLPAWTLLCREVTRFLRQRNRIIGALATPLVFWFLMGSGFNPSFRMPGNEAAESYIAYFFPGTLAMIILFTAIFSTISVIEDRREGFLQGVLVAPVEPGAIVLGQLLGGMVLSALQALLCCLLAPLAGLSLSPVTLLMLIPAFLVFGFALSGLGLAIAWPMDSTQGFHAIMNIFLIPLWMLSGALFPTPRDGSWIDWITRLNPVSYGVSAVRAAFQAGDEGALQTYVASMGVVAGFAVVMYALCVWIVYRRRGS